MNLGRRVLVIAIIVIFWVALFLWLGRWSQSVGYGSFSRDSWAMMLIGASLFTFFGILQLPGNVDEHGAFQESRMRLAISATLIVTYIVYLGSVAYLEPQTDPAGNRIHTFGEEVFPTVTQLLTVTISFYFWFNRGDCVCWLATKKGWLQDTTLTLPVDGRLGIFSVMGRRGAGAHKSNPPFAETKKPAALVCWLSDLSYPSSERLAMAGTKSPIC